MAASSAGGIRPAAQLGRDDPRFGGNIPCAGSGKPCGDRNGVPWETAFMSHHHRNGSNSGSYDQGQAKSIAVAAGMTAVLAIGLLLLVYSFSR